MAKGAGDRCRSKASLDTVGRSLVATVSCIGNEIVNDLFELLPVRAFSERDREAGREIQTRWTRSCLFPDFPPVR